MAATQCMRWVFTGSEDGYVRKYDFFASMNGKTLLTATQRHGQVESVTKVTTSRSRCIIDEDAPTGSPRGVINLTKLFVKPTGWHSVFLLGKRGTT